MCIYISIFYYEVKNISKKKIKLISQNNKNYSLFKIKEESPSRWPTFMQMQGRGVDQDSNQSATIVTVVTFIDNQHAQII